MQQNKKLNICFVLPEAYHYFNRNLKLVSGGAELQLFLLSTELAKNKNFEVSFIVGDFGQHKTERINNVKLIKSFNAKRNHSFIKKLLQAIKFFKILLNLKPDIIISTTNNTTVTLCSFFSKFYKSKHIHRIAHNKDTGKERKKEFGALALLYIFGMKNANKILVQNSEQQKLLLENFNKKSIILKNAFHIKNTIKNKKTNVLWVSRFQKWKNPELFLKLAKKIPEEHFTMICPYNKKDKFAWERLKQKADKLSNFTLIEKVPFNEIQEYFNKAKVFVNTSDAEGFPNTFLQAAQGKTPIISLNVNPDSFINKYDCGIFCNNNFNELVEKTKHLLQNKKELEIKGKNAYIYLKENHDINNITKQLEQIISSLL